MFDDLRELYQEVILDHGKKPRNFRHPDDFTCEAAGNNPMCGDALIVYLTVDDNRMIRDVAFQGKGCAISVASASMMTEMLKNISADEADTLFKAFHGLCTGADDADDLVAGLDEEVAERLQMLSGVRQFPMRVKCATLAWHTMDAAINGHQEISTE